MAEVGKKCVGVRCVQESRLDRERLAGAGKNEGDWRRIATYVPVLLMEQCCGTGSPRHGVHTPPKLCFGSLQRNGVPLERVRCCLRGKLPRKRTPATEIPTHLAGSFALCACGICVLL